ncbi:hypothetical protein DZD18_03205 [Rhodobacteraceae bacterium W635]|uniref:hypothetical protein n=1 Tax=Nioella halotolerans TaxID=2303578 RepID=UPI000E3EDF87|nr:hypothetical protein DZD18_03205 [Rhodobacteraceae bacterium W635]
MDLLVVLLIFAAVLIGLFLVVRHLFRALRASAGRIKDAGAEMYASGTRMSVLIQPHDDPVEAVIDPRMATVGLAAVVLSRNADLSKPEWLSLRQVVEAHYRTGEAQAGDLVILSQWLAQKLTDEGDIPRLARRAEILGGPQVADDLQALVSRFGDATGRSAEPALSEALSALSR